MIENNDSFTLTGKDAYEFIINMENSKELTPYQKKILKEIKTTEFIIHDKAHNSDRESMIISKYQVKLNKNKVRNKQLLLKLQALNEQSKYQAKFSDILSQDYPEVYEKVRDKYLEKYGSTPKKKDLIKKYLNELSKSTPTNIWYYRRLKTFFPKHWFEEIKNE